MSLYIVNLSIHSEQNTAANCVHYMESGLYFILEKDGAEFKLSSPSTVVVHGFYAGSLKVKENLQAPEFRRKLAYLRRYELDVSAIESQKLKR